MSLFIGKATVFSFFFLVLTFSVFASTTLEDLGKDNFHLGEGLWNEDTPYTIASRDTGGTFMPMVSDLDADGINEIVVLTGSSFTLYHGHDLTIVASLDSANLRPFFSIADVDSDGDKEIVAVNGTTKRYAKFFSYNGTNFFLKKSLLLNATLSAAGGNDFAKCDNNSRQCLYIYSKYAGVGSALAGFRGLYFNYTNSAKDKSLDYTSGSDYCLPAVPDIEFKNYDGDTVLEAIFSYKDFNSGTDKLNIVIVSQNGTGSLITERSVSVAGIYDCGGSSGNCNTPAASLCSSTVGATFTAPSTFDYYTGGNMEHVIGYMVSLDDYELRRYLFDLSSSEVDPTFLHPNGRIMGNVFRGKFWSDDPNSYCVFAEEKTIDRIDVFCASAITGAAVDNWDYAFDKPDGQNLSGTPANYDLLAYAVDYDADDFSEVLTAYGVLKPDIKTCPIGLCDIVWENPQTGAACIGVDVEKVGAEDIICNSATNIWYYDDGYVNSAPNIGDGTKFDPCTSSQWKVNTSVHIDVEVTDADSDQVRARAVLYYGTAYSQNTTWSAWRAAGTVISLVPDMVANVTAGTAYIKIFATDIYNNTDTDVVSVVIGTNGVVKGDCSDNPISGVGPGADGEDTTSGVGITSETNNTVKYNTRKVLEGTGIGTAVLVLLVIVIIDLIVLFEGSKLDMPPNSIMFVLVLIDILLLFTSRGLGLIGTGLLVSICLVATVAGAAFIWNGLRSSG